MIYQGSCVLKKKIYVNTSSKISTKPAKEEFGYNYVIPTVTKSFDVLSLGVGSFSGVEVLYTNRGKYKYTLEVCEDNTILFEFDINDYENERNMLDQIKLCLFEGYILQEKNIKMFSKTIKKQSLVPGYRNILKIGLKRETPKNLIQQCIKELKHTSKSIGKSTLNPSFSLKNFNQSNNNKIDNGTSYRSMFSWRRQQSVDPFEAFERRRKKTILLKKKNKKEIDNLYQKISVENLSTEKLLRNSTLYSLEKSLHKSISNFDNKQISYETSSFKIPLVSSLP